MPVPRPRSTLRQWMIVIIAAALLLAAFVQAIEWRRRQVLIELLRAEIDVNQLAQAEARAMADTNHDGQISHKEAQGYEETMVGLRQEGEELRQKLARLQR